MQKRLQIDSDAEHHALAFQREDRILGVEFQAVGLEFLSDLIGQQRRLVTFAEKGVVVAVVHQSDTEPSKHF